MPKKEHLSMFIHLPLASGTPGGKASSKQERRGKNSEGHRSSQPTVQTIFEGEPRLALRILHGAFTAKTLRKGLGSCVSLWTLWYKEMALTVCR
ncbi:rCG21501 [Rattus norvegicus]|uniref:RCG21501 n=1 Tax=Rattus norvegicus TaxID=10116 RepID=A6J065_RAT|nr:rCG21501 [Rattus norvegicus]